MRQTDLAYTRRAVRLAAALAPPQVPDEQRTAANVDYLARRLRAADIQRRQDERENAEALKVMRENSRRTTQPQGIGRRLGAAARRFAQAMRRAMD